MAGRVLEIELTAPIPDCDVQGYDYAMVLVRHRGTPLGAIWIPTPGPMLRAADIRAAIQGNGDLVWRLAERTVGEWLLHNQPKRSESLPTWSVVICTRDRTEDLRRCLDSLLLLDAPPGGEIIVVDNASSSDETARLAAGYPVRYVREERPGLNWARGCGARAATGEIVVYTDDDVVVDRNWIRQILQPFRSSRVGAVTGMAQPLELETRAQELFERYGGFSRGFQAKVYDHTVLPPSAASRVGAGANMALRRSLVIGMRLFDAELDCGTAALTGGDAYAFYLLLSEGYQIVYLPDALVWHRHRRSYADLKKTLYGYSVGGYAFLLRCLLVHGDWDAVGVGLSWFWHDHLRMLKCSLLRRRRRLPLGLALTYLMGCVTAPWAYFRSRRRERLALVTNGRPLHPASRRAA